MPVLSMDGLSFRLGTGSDLAGELHALSADTDVVVAPVDGDDMCDGVVADLASLGDRLLLIKHVALDRAGSVSHRAQPHPLTGSIDPPPARPRMAAV